VLREYFSSYLWLLQVSEYFQQWTMWRLSLETRWVINILEWFFDHIYWARDFFWCVSDEDVIKSFQESRNGLWRFSLRISCKPVMKTYNLFHLYIIITILLLLVIEVYHFISIDELHHFSLYPHDQNPKSASVLRRCFQPVLGLISTKSTYSVSLAWNQLNEATCNHQLDWVSHFIL